MNPPWQRNSPVRVLQVLHGLARAGAEQLVYELAVENRARMSTQVVCLDHEGPLADALRREGVAIHPTRRREGLDLSQVRRIARVVRAFHPHVVHCHQYTPFFYGALASLLGGRGKVLFTEHGRHYPDVVAARRRAFNRFLVRKAAHVTAVCRFTRERLVRLEGIPPSRIEVIYNGVDPSSFDRAGARAEARRSLHLPAEAGVVMQVGTFRPVKDQATAVRAFGHVRRREPGALLVFVGDGPDRPACEALAETMGLKGAVRFLGQRGDVPRVLPAADVILLTSLSEAHSVSLLEGMATGLAVVATDVGGVGETVVHGRTGLLAPAGDAEAIASALVRLLADADLRRRMGRAGRSRVCTRFRRSDMHRRYLEIYQRLAGRTP